MNPTKATTSPPPTSILKHSNTNSENRFNPNASSSLTIKKKEKKHVKGLWNDHNSALSHLADRHIQHIFSFLDPHDLFRCEMVSPGWRAIAGRDELWETVELTGFVSSTCRQFARHNNNTKTNPTDQTKLAVVPKPTQY